jgi:glycosyltransferase involved in cell wall biosynthesis
MRILQVVGKLDRGGAETWLVQIFRQIERPKYQFDFLVHTEEPGAYDDEVRALGARVIPCLAPRNPFRYGVNFLRILRKFGPYDCVHSHVHHFSGYPMFLAKVAGVKLRLAHSHTAHIESEASSVRRMYLAAMKQLIERYATCVLAVNDQAGASLVAQGTDMQSRLKLCPIGIELGSYAEPIDRPAARKQLGILEDALVVGHVGRFAEPKNHVFLVEIANALLAKSPRARFVLVGDGPLRSRVERMAKDYRIFENFIFTGSSSNVPDLLRLMDVFVFPSLYEGMPLALLEAQATGLPCVVSANVPASACAIRENLEVLSLADGPQKWADAVLQAALKPRYSTVRPELQNYSVQESLRSLSEVYCETPCA